MGDAPIPAAQLSFAVYVPIGTDAEGRLVVRGVRGDELIRLR